MTKLEKMAFEEAKKRFAKINAFVPEEQHIAEAALQIARMGAADIYMSGFRAAREQCAVFLEEKTQHNGLFVPGFLPKLIRAMGEEEL